MRRAQPAPPPSSRLAAFFGVFRYSRRALALVWQTSRPLTIGLAVCTLIAGVLPAVAAWIGQLIVDSVVDAMAYHRETGEALTFESAWPVLRYVLAEAGVIAAIAMAQRGLSAQQSLLRALLGQKVNVMILEKAGTLSLTQFEDSEFYDKLTRARREASIRPLGLVNKTFGLAQNGISLVSFGVLLVQFSPWALLILVIGALPVFLSEAKFSGDAFRLFRWRSPQTRMQMYLEPALGPDCGGLQDWARGNVVKVLCFCHPQDDEGLWAEQIATVERLFRAARRQGLEFLLEVIPSKVGAVDDQTTAQIIARFYAAGIYPDWWKLEPLTTRAAWARAIATIEAHDPHTRGIVVLGLDAPEAELAASFATAAGFAQVKGFAVGRTIFADAARRWLAGACSDDEAREEMRARYARLCMIWDDARARAAA